ncbi:hypothetical protein [Lunatimonas salinarum]|uniref:hypothetical protein n=1 Tax=Lunatimonas salinarum TaxID=1774590 RepID=UPI001ADF7A73|nr:hypothetical protein [Lunatimonas salinarum]
MLKKPSREILEGFFSGIKLDFYERTLSHADSLFGYCLAASDRIPYVFIYEIAVSERMILAKKFPIDLSP